MSVSVVAALLPALSPGGELRPSRLRRLRLRCLISAETWQDLKQVETGGQSQSEKGKTRDNKENFKDK